MNWDDQMGGNHEKAKTPSAILYLGEQEEQGGSSTWGYNIRSEENPLRWFKLLLIDEGDLQPNLRGSPLISSARRELTSLNKTAIEVIADYLRMLWGHTTKQITRALSEDIFNNSGLVISITLPAIWPDYAQARMREAVSLAGILDSREAGDTVLRFISEPEAAALATIQDMEGRPDIEVFANRVIC
jgi:molecular chaperone DnaK (HSP70)